MIAEFFEIIESSSSPARSGVLSLFSMFLLFDFLRCRDDGDEPGFVVETGDPSLKKDS